MRVIYRCINRGIKNGLGLRKTFSFCRMNLSYKDSVNMEQGINIQGVGLGIKYQVIYIERVEMVYRFIYRLIVQKEIEDSIVEGYIRDEFIEKVEVRLEKGDIVVNKF